MNHKSENSKKKLGRAHRHSFLLRLWCPGEPGTAVWRASLETPGAEKRIGFTSLEQLFAFLMDLSEGNDDILSLEDKGKRTETERKRKTEEQDF